MLSLKSITSSAIVSQSFLRRVQKFSFSNPQQILQQLSTIAELANTCGSNKSAFMHLYRQHVDISVPLKACLGFQNPEWFNPEDSVYEQILVRASLMMLQQLELLAVNDNQQLFLPKISQNINSSYDIQQIQEVIGNLLSRLIIKYPSIFDNLNLTVYGVKFISKSVIVPKNITLINASVSGYSKVKIYAGTITSYDRNSIVIASGTATAYSAASGARVYTNSVQAQAHAIIPLAKAYATVPEAIISAVIGAECQYIASIIEEDVIIDVPNINQEIVVKYEGKELVSNSYTNDKIIKSKSLVLLEDEYSKLISKSTTTTNIMKSQSSTIEFEIPQKILLARWCFENDSITDKELEIIKKIYDKLYDLFIKINNAREHIALEEVPNRVFRAILLFGVITNNHPANQSIDEAATLCYTQILKKLIAFIKMFAYNVPTPLHDIFQYEVPLIEYADIWREKITNIHKQHTLGIYGLKILCNADKISFSLIREFHKRNLQEKYGDIPEDKEIVSNAEWCNRLKHKGYKYKYIDNQELGRLSTNNTTTIAFSEILNSLQYNRITLNAAFKSYKISDIKKVVLLIDYDTNIKYLTLAEMCSKYNIHANQFNQMVRYEEGLTFKTRDNLPNVVIHDTKNNFKLRKLPVNSKLPHILGNISNCCLHTAGIGEKMVIDGMTRENNGFYIITKNEEIMGQCYAWISTEGNLVLDSVDIANRHLKSKCVINCTYDLLQKFADEVIKHYPHINIVTIGSGSGTNKIIRLNLLSPVTSQPMREGLFCGDANTQYCLQKSEFLKTLPSTISSIKQAKRYLKLKADETVFFKHQVLHLAQLCNLPESELLLLDTDLDYEKFQSLTSYPAIILYIFNGVLLSDLIDLPVEKIKALTTTDAKFAYNNGASINELKNLPLVKIKALTTRNALRAYINGIKVNDLKEYDVGKISVLIDAISYNLDFNELKNLSVAEIKDKVEVVRKRDRLAMRIFYQPV